jgi:pimeloyl-ACP methyl ester carboxylesterase
MRSITMIDRRALSTMLIAGVATSLLGRSSKAQPRPAESTHNVVLVHGAYADGSCWSEVIGRLQSAGLKATAVQNPLTSLADDVAATQRILALLDGPTVLVAHSWGGMVITEAGIDPKVSALVYVAARAPDAGEDYTALAAKFPTPPASAGLVKSGGFAQLSEEAFLRDFAGDLEPAKARILIRRAGTDLGHPIFGENNPGGLAVEAKSVRHLHGRPDDLARTGAVHGSSDEGQHDRGQGQSPVSHLASAGDYRPHLERRRPQQLTSDLDRRSVAHGSENFN